MQLLPTLVAVEEEEVTANEEVWGNTMEKLMIKDEACLTFGFFLHRSLFVSLDENE